MQCKTVIVMPNGCKKWMPEGVCYCVDCQEEIRERVKPELAKEEQEKARRVMKFYYHMLQNPRLSVMRVGKEFLIYQDAITLLVTIPVEMVYSLPPHELIPACRELYARKKSGIPRDEQMTTVYVC